MKCNMTKSQDRAAEAISLEYSREQNWEYSFRDDAVRPTSQAERAVMHPEQHDPEWRYYYGAWHS